MKEREWKPILLADAANAGICGQYAGLLGRCGGLTDFLRLYRRGADWALEHNVPSLSMLRRLSDDRLDLHGIYIDRNFEGDTLWDKQIYILRNCKGVIRTGLNVGNSIIPIFYIADGSEITFESANEENIGTISISVWLYGGSSVKCNDEKLKCTIHAQNDNSKA